MLARMPPEKEYMTGMAVLRVAPSHQVLLCCAFAQAGAYKADACTSLWPCRLLGSTKGCQSSAELMFASDNAESLDLRMVSQECQARHSSSPVGAGSVCGMV